jgi:hypothetical protein
MREETKRRLERALLVQRLKWIAAGAGLAAVLAGLLLLTGLDADVEKRHVAGVVEHVAPAAARTAQNGLAVDVVLEDGRRVQVLALKTTDRTLAIASTSSSTATAPVA